jgi:aminoglycoside phosphotransferase family enzyme/predicted kinase
MLVHFENLSPTAQSLLQFLTLPDSLPKDFNLIGFAETHLSLVLIGEHEAWKFKKQVDFGFVNQLTIEQRWKGAVAEIVLNRRLTTDIYLGVRAFWKSHLEQSTFINDPTLALPDQISEVAVVMRTIDHNILLDNQIKANAPLNDQIKLSAELIAHFHKQHSILNTARIKESIHYFKKAVSDNFKVTSSLLPLEIELIELIKDDADRLIETNTETLLTRGEKGLFVDGHGDLRAEHIALTKAAHTKTEIQILDCVEFSEEIRFCDVLNDVAFLAMDLDFLGRHDLSTAFINSYLQISPQASNNSLLRLFKQYRSMVRCKVELLTAKSLASDLAQEHTEKAVRFLGLASRYRFDIEGPLVIALAGTIGSGKSSIAAELSKRLSAPHLESDYIRQQLFPTTTNIKEEFGKGKYSSEGKALVYSQIFKEVRANLLHQEIVIVDASFSRRQDRQSLEAIAKENNSKLLWILCDTDPEIIKERVKRREASKLSKSEGRVELLQVQRASFEPFEDDVKNLLRIDTGIIEAKRLCEDILRSF